MIDFRYHLVSIVSVFLALAVGIVLGAGPLKEDLGTTLTQEVTKLRDDKAALRSQLDAANRGVEARDAFTAAANPTLLAGRLGGRTVALVVFPGADSAVVKATSTSLAQAGATEGATITVGDAWVDPNPQKETERATLGDGLLSSLKLEAPGSGQSIDKVLAASAVGVAPSSSGATGNGVTPEGATAALEQLRKADLVSISPDKAPQASSVIVIGAPITKGAPAEQKARAQGLAELAAAFDRGSSGAVLVSDVRGLPVQGESVVAAARADAAIAKELSTVDDGGVPMGQASVVVALQEQYAGVSGHYGLASDADEAFAPLEGSK